jgi:hypothetical protein
MFILLFLFSCAGTYYFLYKHIIDAIEFTCINYDEFILDSTQLCTQEVKKKAIKYEDKYKTELAKTPCQIIVNPLHITERFDILLKQSIAEITDKINRELVSYEWELIKSTERNDEQEQRAFFINDKMERMKMELFTRILDKASILKLSESILIQERLTNLKFSFVMEHTPIGNVVMYYNHTKEAFEYYSDNVVPYRYLDTVCRKYVIANLCVPLYVDINEELKEFQKKVEERKCEERKCEEPTTKSTVFAKLKNYKQRPINTPVITKPVKARTNKYLYQGRMNNFNFMKQAETKPALSYTEYKQRLLNK